MKVLFKVKTQYSEQIYNNFLQFHQAKYGNKYRFFTLIIALLLLFCSIVNITSSNYLTGIIYFIILILFFVYQYIHPIKKITKEIQSDKIQKQTEYTFTFYDNFLKISDNKNFQKIKYWKLYKIFEDNSCIYIYQNKSYAFILDKNNFLVGNPKDFMKFIKKKIIFKFWINLNII